MWRLGVVGDPVSHSLSPLLHRAGLAMAGLTGTSERIAMRLGDVDRLVSVMGERFDALSVTMPLKSAAAELCDQLDSLAARTGMVNSLLERDGQLYGANTDGEGFVDALVHEFAASLDDSRVVVLGAGGAARAIVDAVVRHGVAAVVVIARTPSKVDWLSTQYDNVFNETHRLDRVDFVVNTTPVESRGAPSAVLDGVSDSTIGVDITYEPRVSAWRTTYESAGCRTTNGLGMLAHQAARQMQWWWNVEIDGAQLLEVIQ